MKEKNRKTHGQPEEIAINELTDENYQEYHVSAMSCSMTPRGDISITFADEYPEPFIDPETTNKHSILRIYKTRVTMSPQTLKAFYELIKRTSDNINITVHTNENEKKDSNHHMYR